MKLRYRRSKTSIRTGNWSAKPSTTGREKKTKKNSSGISRSGMKSARKRNASSRKRENPRNRRKKRKRSGRKPSGRTS